MSILDTIDGALTDWETSPDAMRWTTDTTVLEAAPLDDIDPERFVAAMNQMARAMGQWAEQTRKAMVKFAADAAPIIEAARRQVAEAGR